MENQPYLKRPDFIGKFLWKGAAGPGFLWEVSNPPLPLHSSLASDCSDYFLGGTDITWICQHPICEFGSVAFAFRSVRYFSQILLAALSYKRKALGRANSKSSGEISGKKA